MTDVGVHEAKTTFSKLLRRVAAGEEITITSSGKAAARLIPAHPASRREFGIDHGLFEVPEDFNAPLPDYVLADFAPPPRPGRPAADRSGSTGGPDRTHRRPGLR